MDLEPTVDGHLPEQCFVLKTERFDELVDELMRVFKVSQHASDASSAAPAEDLRCNSSFRSDEPKKTLMRIGSLIWSRSAGLREPLKELAAARVGDGVDLTVGAVVLDFDCHLDEPFGLHRLEGGVNLAQLGVPEVGDGGVEELLELVAGHGAVVDEAEQGVLKGHLGGTAARVMSVIGDNGAKRAAVEVKGQVGESFGKMRPESREAVRFDGRATPKGGSEAATVRDFRIEPDLA